jgi:FixJ family two-component response regulator
MSRGDIIVVEDDASLNQAVSRLLQVAGFRTHAFTSAEAALASDQGNTAACWVVDVRLPGMSGLDLCVQLHETAPRRSVVVVTAHDDALTRSRAAALGAAYLTKPFTGRKLIDTIMHLTGQA